MLKEKLDQLVAKAKEHKDVLIRVGVAVAGAAIGAGVTAAVIHFQNQTNELLLEDEILEEEDEELEAE